jgi:hypothetical protein
MIHKFAADCPVVETTEECQAAVGQNRRAPLDDLVQQSKDIPATDCRRLVRTPPWEDLPRQEPGIFTPALFMDLGVSGQVLGGDLFNRRRCPEALFVGCRIPPVATV